AHLSTWGAPTWPPTPPTLGVPRGTRGTPRFPACSSLDVGGPDMAPHTPQRSECRGEPVALLDSPRAHLSTWGAPTWPPTPPNARSAPGNPWHSSSSRVLICRRGGPR